MTVPFYASVHPIGANDQILCDTLRQQECQSQPPLPSCNTHLPIKRVAAEHQLQEAHGDREQLRAQARPRSRHLLCRVVRGAVADVRGKNCYLLLDAEAKVGENSFSVLGHEDVLWLDVPVEKPDGAKEFNRSEGASEHPVNSSRSNMIHVGGGGAMVQPQRRRGT